MDSAGAERARSFGQVAEQYDRHRPGYPDALYDTVLDLVPGRRVLEAGAGTGRATVALARRGAEVVAVEPDPAMAAVARDRVADLGARVVETPFEQYPAEPGGFDLVVAAQAWHWVDRERGSAAAARALAPGGVLALWWNRPRDHGGPVWDAVQAVYRRIAPELDRAGELGPQPEREAVAEPADGFRPWTRRVFDWSTIYDAATYRGLIATHSHHLLLPCERRERLLEGVHDAIAAHGERVDYRYRSLLLTAPPP